jgi:hypothetical protein
MTRAAFTSSQKRSRLCPGKRRSRDPLFLLASAGSNITNALRQETIVAQIRIRIERPRSQENRRWLAQYVSRSDGEIEGRILETSLSALHPTTQAPFGSGGLLRPTVTRRSRESLVKSSVGRSGRGGVGSERHTARLD